MAERKSFPKSIIPLPATGALASHELTVSAATAQHRRALMHLHFSLGIPAARLQELEARVARGERVPLDEQATHYGVDPAAAKALSTWLAQHGFKVSHVSGDHTSVYASADASAVEAALGVHVVCVTRHGKEYMAARDQPSLPPDIGAAVSHIGGLQPFLHAHRHSRMAPVAVEAQASAASAFNPPFNVAAILKAYGADALGVSGAGQEIAILIDTAPLPADLTAFWHFNGINADGTRVTVINVAGGTLPPQEGEESLDVEWTSGIAPGAAIRVYASGSLEFSALDRALDQIIADAGKRPGLRQVSISLGLGETFFGGAGGEVATQHQKFLQLAAAGINVFVSTGDAGSNPDQSGHAGGGPLQPEYEASDPCVVAVGGTSLTMDARGAVTSEVGWPGSGGGISHYFPRPAWQVAQGIPAGSQRSVPDVALVADPNTGAVLFLQGKKEQIGGTSWATPVWAAFCALINEARLKKGLDALPFLNPLLYPLQSSHAFRDIVSGSNGQYEAASGYDLVTGLGVPNMAGLMQKLVG